MWTQKAMNVNVDWEQKGKNTDLLEAASRGNIHAIRWMLNNDIELLDQRAEVKKFIKQRKDAQQPLQGAYITTGKTPNHNKKPVVANVVHKIKLQYNIINIL